jgi:hypothetical protein
MPIRALFSKYYKAKIKNDKLVMEWFYVFSRDQSNGQIDLQRFETLDEANIYKTTMSMEYWDSVVVEQADMELFNFFDGEVSHG